MNDIKWMIKMRTFLKYIIPERLIGIIWIDLILCLSKDKWEWGGRVLMPRKMKWNEMKNSNTFLSPTKHLLGNSAI